MVEGIKKNYYRFGYLKWEFVYNIFMGGVTSVNTRVGIT
jgi:hypothetical protein